MLKFQNNNPKQAIEILEEGLDNINSSQIKEKNLYQQDFLLRLSMIYLNEKCYEIAHDYLLDEVFDNDFQPFDYLTIRGDIFYGQGLFLNAFDSYQ